MVAGIAPVSDAGGIAAQPRIGGAVANDTAALEADGAIGITLTGCKGIAEADDQPVFDMDVGRCDGRAVDEGHDIGAGRIGDFDRYRDAAGRTCARDWGAADLPRAQTCVIR